MTKDELLAQLKDVPGNHQICAYTDAGLFEVVDAEYNPPANMSEGYVELHLSSVPQE